MNKFHQYFKRPGAELKAVLKEMLSDGMKIADLGCHDGTLVEVIDSCVRGCEVDAVDVDEKSLAELEKKSFRSTKVKIIRKDVMDYISSFRFGKADMILANAILHELADVREREKTVDIFLKKSRSRLADGGILILADYFYPEHIPEKKVKEHMAKQRKSIGHADEREKFADPKIIAQKVLENKMHIEKFFQVRAVKGIDMKYFVFVVRK